MEVRKTSIKIPSNRYNEVCSVNKYVTHMSKKHHSDSSIDEILNELGVT